MFRLRRKHWLKKLFFVCADTLVQSPWQLAVQQVWLQQNILTSSVDIFAEIPLRSPRKRFIVILKIYIYRIKVSEKNTHLILKKTSLLRRWQYPIKIWENFQIEVHELRLGKYPVGVEDDRDSEHDEHVRVNGTREDEEEDLRGTNYDCDGGRTSIEEQHAEADTIPGCCGD